MKIERFIDFPKTCVFIVLKCGAVFEKHGCLTQKYYLNLDIFILLTKFVNSTIRVKCHYAVQSGYYDSTIRHERLQGL